MRRPSILGLALVACATVTVAASSEATTQRPAFPSKLLVLDVELSGDLGGPELVPEHQARLKLANAELRESLSRTGLYQLVDSTPARSTIEELKARYLYLHDCNGCDLDIARQLGADRCATLNRLHRSGLIHEQYARRGAMAITETDVEVIAARIRAYFPSELRDTAFSTAAKAPFHIDSSFDTE